MNLLSEITAAVPVCGLSVEPGVFSGEPPENYVAVTTVSDTSESDTDHLPRHEIQDARPSLLA